MLDKRLVSEMVRKDDNRNGNEKWKIKDKMKH